MRLSPTVRASLELLGVGAEANAVELKRAYHKLALVYHPDRNADPSAVAEFRRVTEAYDLLSDPARVLELNGRHLKSKLQGNVIEGLDITFGWLFGYRVFSPGGGDLRHPLEENGSILDHPAYDALEVVYAGRFSLDDEEKLKGGVRGRELADLPWVVLNNQGLIRFLDGDLRRAEKCYAEICARVPNNIVFTYRYALCLVLTGFKSAQRTLLGGLKPDRVRIEQGLRLLEHCVKLGTERPVGRQKCLVIRKIIADIHLKLGRPRAAKAIWREILAMDPRSKEARYRLAISTAQDVKELDSRRGPRLLSGR